MSPMRAGKRKAQSAQAHKHTPWGALSEQAEKLKARARAKVEHPYRVLKCQFGFVKGALSRAIASHRTRPIRS
jgi:transposase, IS5 family